MDGIIDVGSQVVIEEAKQRLGKLGIRGTLSYAFTDGIFTVSGCVSSFYHKQMAQESLRRIIGVRRVINELDVAYRE